MRFSQLISIVHLLVVYIHAAVEFTNIVCIPLDESYAGFEYCFLKSINRSYKYMSLKVNIYDLPVNNVTVNWTIMKKANGYKPFLYNFTFDACKYMKSPRKYPVIYFFHQLFWDYTNMNHTCPWDTDVIVEKLPVSHINHQFTNILPFPKGQFAAFTTWSANGIPRANVNVFITLT